MTRRKADIMDGVKDIVSSKFIGANTIQYTTTDGRTVIRLHDTDIVTIMPKGKIILNSGGWRTSTTKSRMNDYLSATTNYNVGVYQLKGQWYVHVRDKDNPQNVPFVDGITIKNGRVMDKYVKQADAVEKKKAKLDKQLKGYMVHVQKALDDNQCMPNEGDCWYCLLQTEDGRTLGDVSHSDHIISHIKEGYVPGALIWNAVKESGRKPEYWLHPSMRSRMGSDKDILRMVKNYLKKRLAVAY